MSDETTIRQQALNTEKSFIIQAPAGSGKTTLLVQRFLALLAQVENPEEIVAITFTKKAAAEMKCRIIDALKEAATSADNKVYEDHKAITYNLAKKALLTDKKLKWNLLENSNRLKIQTIDSLCSSITRQLPLLSQILPTTNILEAAEIFKYYNLAITTILQDFDDAELDAFYSEKLEIILYHLDNDRSRIKNLMIEMLSNRDQWLAHFLNLRNLKNEDQSNLKNILQLGLRNIVKEAIENFQEAFPISLKSELETLINYAAQNLKYSTTKENNKNNSIEYLQFIASILLTEELKYRKTINKNQGFPAKNDASDKEEQEFFSQMKTRMQSFLQTLEDYPEICNSLINLKKCPPEKYSTEQWEILASLIELLPLLVAQLKILFERDKVADFTEIAMAANAALGQEDNPSDLALNLDYKIKHLLVDEFQDTSISQYRLLEKLTSSWENNDGRTLFLVGDPMQSIYRFRQAEVSLFLRAKQEGLGNISLIPLTLALNYRSSENIINWLNDNFEKILPKKPNQVFGAVTFSKTQTPQDKKNYASTVKINLLVNVEADIAANHTVTLIKNILACNPEQDIAILGRSRSHFIDIINSLNKENIAFSAVELEILNQNEIIKDLVALARAVYNLDDKIAWLSVLRAPWCGLTLEDLHKITIRTENSENNTTTIFERLCKQTNFSTLSNAGVSTIQRILPPLTDAVYNKQKYNSRKIIEKLWRQIGGPACLTSENELEIAEVFFALLEKLDKDNFLDLDIEMLENSLQQLFADAKAKQNSKIQLMTIHKAKGLEFDNVFIVGIDREVKSDTKKLILWTERPLKHGQIDFLIAPINTIENNKEPIYEYLQNIETKKSYYEIGRLLYVAATRAKKNLYLIGEIKTADNEANQFIKPGRNSFLEQLWPMFSSDWIVPTCHSSNITTDTKTNRNEFKRLTPSWQNPYSEFFIDKQDDSSSQYLFKLNDEAPLKIGTVIHRAIQQLCEYLINHDQLNIDHYIENNRAYWNAILLENSLISKNELYLNMIIDAIKNSFHDSKGKWILQDHKEAKNEYEITTINNDKIEHLIIDRTFIDMENNRWIIDYKTSTPKDQSIDVFLSNELQLYKNQLEKYAIALQKIDQRKIFLGLYFPLCQKWIQWQF